MRETHLLRPRAYRQPGTLTSGRYWIRRNNFSGIYRGLWLVAVASVIAACQSREQQPSSESPSVDTTAIRASIDTLAAKVMRAEETGDFGLLATTWASDGMMALPGSPPVRGRDSIMGAFRRRPPLPPGASMTIHPTEIQILSPQWAYVWGVDTLRYTPQGATAAVTKTSTFLVVLRKTTEGWQTYREVLSANQP